MASASAPQQTEEVALTMLRIPAGSFLMGAAEKEADSRDSERPVHRVTLAEFLLAQTPITQAQWRAVAQWQRPEPVGNEEWPDTLDPDPVGKLQGAGRLRGDQRQVVNVSWRDALDFCQRLRLRSGKNYTLPSEAQWEYACRAGTTTPFYFGETISSELANYNGNYAYGDSPKGEYRKQTSDVEMFPANAWGLHDMQSNVWEWCFDHWHDNYVGAPDDCRPWLEKDDLELPRERVMRGGSWNSEAVECSAACRSFSAPHVTDEKIGFPVVCLPYSSQSDATHQSGSFFEIDRTRPSIPLKELKLSQATQQSFLAAGVKYVDDLMGFSYEDLLQIAGIGVRGADEVIESLELLGITLPQERTSERFGCCCANGSLAPIPTAGCHSCAGLAMHPADVRAM